MEGIVYEQFCGNQVLIRHRIFQHLAFELAGPLCKKHIPVAYKMNLCYGTIAAQTAVEEYRLD